MIEEGHQKPCQILVCEDDPCLCVSISDALRAAGFSLAVCGSRREALAQVAQWTPRPGLVIVSTRLEHLATDLRSRYPGVPLITISERAQAGGAKRSMSAGSSASFAREALDIAGLVQAARDALGRPTVPEPVHLVNEVVTVTRGQTVPDDLGMIGRHPSMEALRDRIRRAGRGDSTVLVTGETGAGKELVAQAVHALSQRGVNRLVSVNCAAMPEHLLESELFGHLRGAYTGAYESRDGLLVYAAGGTVFLDEIASMPVALQAKLLRVLDERKVRPVGGSQARGIDVRIVAAANEDLGEAARDGRFRRDLFYRLSVFTISVPPLRERGDDVILLAKHFIESKGEMLAMAHPPTLSKAALNALRRYDWPGNVRELASAIESALQLCDGKSIELRHLPTALTGRPTRASRKVPASCPLARVAGWTCPLRWAAGTSRPD